MQLADNNFRLLQCVIEMSLVKISSFSVILCGVKKNILLLEKWCQLKINLLNLWQQNEGYEAAL